MLYNPNSDVPPCLAITGLTAAVAIFVQIFHQKYVQKQENARIEKLFNEIVEREGQKLVKKFKMNTAKLTEQFNQKMNEDGNRQFTKFLSAHSRGKRKRKTNLFQSYSKRNLNLFEFISF